MTAPATIATPRSRPTRPDRVDDDTAFRIGAAEERVQHADAEVEAFEDEEADPEENVDDEPEISECHGGLLVDEGRFVLVGRLVRSGRDIVAVGRRDFGERVVPQLSTAVADHQPRVGDAENGEIPRTRRWRSRCRVRKRMVKLRWPSSSGPGRSTAAARLGQHPAGGVMRNGRITIQGAIRRNHLACSSRRRYSSQHPKRQRRTPRWPGRPSLAWTSTE